MLIEKGTKRKPIIQLFKKKEDGQSMVEFALVLPVLLLLIMGIVQFAIILSGYITITHAVREGARLAAVGRITEAYDRVDEIADMFLLTLDDVDITPDPTVAREPVTVSADGSVPVFFPVLLTSPFPVSSSTTMRVEVASD